MRENNATTNNLLLENWLHFVEVDQYFIYEGW